MDDPSDSQTTQRNRSGFGILATLPIIEADGYPSMVKYANGILAIRHPIVHKMQNMMDYYKKNSLTDSE